MRGREGDLSITKGGVSSLYINVGTGDGLRDCAFSDTGFQERTGWPPAGCVKAKFLLAGQWFAVSLIWHYLCIYLGCNGYRTRRIGKEKEAPEADRDDRGSR